MAINRLLVWPENRIVYATLRDKSGRVWNAKKKSYEAHTDLIGDYKVALDYVGGDLYLFIPPTKVLFTCIIIYEQKGQEPDKYDKVIALFGNKDVVQLNSILIPEKHRPYIPGPALPRK